MTWAGQRTSADMAVSSTAATPRAERSSKTAATLVAVLDGGKRLKLATQQGCRVWQQLPMAGGRRGMAQLAGGDLGDRFESFARQARCEVGAELRCRHEVFRCDGGGGREAIGAFRGEEASQDLREIVAVDPALTVAVASCGQKARIGHVDHLLSLRSEVAARV